MYDISISATSIPSDIHLISSAPMFTLHQQDQQFYEQMFESLADVIGYQPEHHQQLHNSLSHQQQHQQQQQQKIHPLNKMNQSCRLAANQQHHHQKLRSTKSTALANSCNQDHLLFHYKQQASNAREQMRLSSNDEPRSLHPIARHKQQQEQLELEQSSQVQPQDTSAVAAPFCFQQQSQHHYLTIEELKTARNSCWLCGCNWREGHVSLDCPECDGYALTRPCPSCDGKCKQVWQRNITATHDKHRALWMGRCALETARVADQEEDDEEEEEEEDDDEVSDCSSSH